MPTDEAAKQTVTDYPQQSNKDIQLLQLLLAHYTHHDTLFWSRINFVFYVQAAALGGAWNQRNDSPTTGICLLIIALMMTAIWLFIFNRDLQSREENRQLIDELAGRVKRDLELDVAFRIGGKIAELKPLYKRDCEGEEPSSWIVRRLDSGIFLKVPARAIILMRGAIVLVVSIDLLFLAFLVFRLIWGPEWVDIHM